MEASVPGRLAGWDIHGFRTLEDLDVGNMMEEAKSRWLRPNEIHAILCNYRQFSVHVKPVNLPESGKIVLFDRKMLRNFRKDGHNWKKKKDGKTVKEAHEHLKVGDEERIHVYYAHGEDNPTFVRRCYWLLDKSLEHIVLVHYRQTQELQGSSVTPVNNSSPALSDPHAPWPSSEESDSVVGPMCYSGGQAPLGCTESMTIKNHEMKLHEINTLEWDDLLVPDVPNTFTKPDEEKLSCVEQQNPYEMNGFRSSMSSANQLSVNGIPLQNSSLGNLTEPLSGRSSVQFHLMDSAGLQISDSQMHSDSKGPGQTAEDAVFSVNNLLTDGLQTQDSFGRWIDYVITNSSDSVDNAALGSSISTGQESHSSSITDHQSSAPELLFSIIDVSPAWAFSTEETKILVVGHFDGACPQNAESNLYCVCGSTCITAEFVHSGVYRCLVSSHSPGLVNLYLTFDGQRPISQVLTFEFRTPLIQNRLTPTEDKCNWEEFRVQMRLAHLLFSSFKHLDIIFGKVSQSTLKEAKSFARKTSSIADSWEYFMKSIEECKIASPQGKDSLFELILKNKLQEWLVERILDGHKISDHDDQGQGVIHLCAILDYTWAVYPFSWSGLSLDYRDKYGWTALHWAAYCGREKMVATLLSAGAKPNLVTDPSSENPGGCTAGDLASKNGYEGLAAYLAEKALVRHFEDMTIAGNVSGSLQPETADVANPNNLSQEELYLKDSLAAYRTAADAAARIQAAFREHTFKLRTKEVIISNPEDEVRNIIAAMKIQHAYRNFETRKKMAAVVRIQHRFRTWKTRRDFLNLRRQAIKIQAVFRGFQVRRQYHKIIWSVGVLEKAILRWRWKRKGFRGLQVSTCQTGNDQRHDSEDVEDFFEASRKQAEDRIERSVENVHAIIGSKKAQEEYQRMKLAHNMAKLEYEVLNSDVDMTQGGRSL